MLRYSEQVGGGSRTPPTPDLKPGQFLKLQTGDHHYVVLYTAGERITVLDLTTHTSREVSGEDCVALDPTQVRGTFYDLACTFDRNDERQRGVISSEQIEGGTGFVQKVYVTHGATITLLAPGDITVTGRSEEHH